MLAIWSLLIVRVTKIEFLGTLRSKPLIKLRYLSFPNNREQFFNLDRSGRLTKANEEEFTLKDSPWNKDDGSLRRWKLSVLNSETGNMDRIREFALPNYMNPTVVANRFVVIPKKDLLSILDIDSRDMTFVDHPAKGVDSEDRMFSPPKTQNLVLLSYKVANKTAIPQVFLSDFDVNLFSVDGTGVPKHLNSWIGAHSSWISFTLIDDQIVTIHPTAGHFEFRSIFDGKIISNPPLPSDLDITKPFSFHFNPGSLSYDESRTYSLVRLRWMKPPSGTHLVSQSDDKKLHLWRGAQECIVTDSESEREQARFAIGEYVCADWFFDDDTIVQNSDGWGFTCRTVSARTGETLRTWRPNWWAFPLLIFIVPGYVVWSIFWLKSVVQSGRSMWADIALIAGLPVVAFCIRFSFVGDRCDLHRLPSHFVLGIFLAVTFVACVFFWCSQQNHLPRSLPLLICLIAISIALEWVFSQQFNFSELFYHDRQSRMVFGGIILLAVLFPVFAAGLFFRLVGFRLRQDTCFSNPNRFSFSIMDLLLVIAASALLFALIRSIGLEELSMVAEAADSTLWTCIAISAFTPCLAWFMAMSKSRTVFWVGIFLSFVAIAILLFAVLYHFVKGYPLQIEEDYSSLMYDRFGIDLYGYGIDLSERFLAEWYAQLCISTTAFASTFLLCQAFRFSGYRWDRPSNLTQRKSESTHQAMDVTPISNSIPPGGTSKIPIPGSPE